jgi:hypothetical protein
MNAILFPALLTLVTATGPVEVVERWDGIVADEALKIFVIPGDFIVDETNFAATWKGWRAGEPVPTVDFARHLILVGVVPGPNRVLLEPTLDERGDVAFTVGGTKKAGPGFGYALVKIARTGVKTVNGKPIAAGQAAGKTIQVTGTVHTGRIVIGGETTGVVIETAEGEYELDARANPELAKQLDKLNGKRAVVEGRLTIKRGVEVRERRIIEVAKVEAAK